LSTESNWRAFSANSGQFDAGSTTTACNGRPSTPPFLFCSAISMSITSFSVVSLIAMVPERECRMPILIGSPFGAATAPRPKPATAAEEAAASCVKARREIRVLSFDMGCPS